MLGITTLARVFFSEVFVELGSFVVSIELRPSNSSLRDLLLFIGTNCITSKQKKNLMHNMSCTFITRIHLSPEIDANTHVKN